jgi:uncharacterized protein (TIGR02145 family)
MKRSLCLLIAFVTIVTSCKKEKHKSLASISTTSVSEITANSVKSGGNINDDGGSQITQRGTCWTDHSNPTIGDSITKDGTGSGTFKSFIAGLNANTTYFIRAYAVNASGTAYGNEVSFKSSAGLATISTTSISDIKPLSAKSGGNVINDGGVPITDRGVVFGTSPNPTTANFKVTAGSGTGSFTTTLSPLASQTSYYARAYAVNSYGTAYGNQVQFNAASANTVSDIEGNVYPYVTIGTQSWMATNLKVTKFKNGDPLTNGLTGYNWNTQPSPAYTFPNGLVNKKDTLGLLYNLAVANDSRGVCPAGWHVPTDNDWKILEINQGMTQTQADQIQDYPGRGTIGAKFLEGGVSGLNIQKAGYVYADVTADYYGYNDWGLYWSSQRDATTVWWRGFNMGSPDAGPIARGFADKTYVLSVRCIKD